MTGVESRRVERVIGSMLWAAWADAVGFISELTDKAGLDRRLGGGTLDHPVAWARRVGGRNGATMDLPVGCYSDDTQLRLAVSRCISSSGFDVEAFARVEVPVWPTYALGGGIASKKAATNLARRDVLWCTNFYEGWQNAGGNGAAMRIQPHVWSAQQPAGLGPHILDVLVDTVVTHGHPRAAVGSVFHALALGLALQQGHAPSEEQWSELLIQTEQAGNLVNDHQQLSTIWLPSWEQAAHRDWQLAWHDTVAELRRDAEVAKAFLATARVAAEGEEVARPAYRQMIKALGLDVAATRGSGTATTIAALALATANPDNPTNAILLAARELGTDTDTIATMAAAIIATSGGIPEPPGPIQDKEYLRAEAVRLTQVAAGKTVRPFLYPELLTWQAPRSQIDAVGEANGAMALAGLGWLEPVHPELTAGKLPHHTHYWEWTRADFGPTFLVKRRTALRPLPQLCWPARRSEGAATTDEYSPPESGPRLPEFLQLPLWDVPPQVTSYIDNPLSTEVRQMLDWAVQRADDNASVGTALRRMAQTASADEFVAFARALRDPLRQSSMRPTTPDYQHSGLLLLDLTEMEHLLSKLFEALGLTHWVTKSSRDDGIDAVAIYDSSEAESSYLIQVKRHRNAVPVHAVQQMAALLDKGPFLGGVLATTSWFGQAAYEVAARSGIIQLIDGRALEALLRQHLNFEPPLQAVNIGFTR